ncbi:TetR family transcriptional regulator [Planctomonas sp. JC2975]|uniref:TetR/AcrR family transcriptional regulator n=1 Tax=Planctomonas sp. JC2975 TaxID=2729626 RepID=UPI001472EAD6|nr:TetR family transcriptional regulator [Planctomonas sp. JC2975]NNC13805.1 TetR family transcriptional regulator [Planctomonas sp. JC2975]
MARRARIDRGAIVSAALELLDEQGVAGLSMRALGSRLGVRAASLYNHVSGRPELQQLIADRVWAGVIDVLDRELPWRHLFEQLAAGLRAGLSAHPGAVQVVAVTNVSVEVYSPAVPIITRAFAGLGVEEPDALLAVASLSVLVIGLAGAEFGDAPQAPVAPPEYYDHWFELAVGTFLDGIEARLNSGS